MPSVPIPQGWPYPCCKRRRKGFRHKPGGSFWVSDLIAHHSEVITKLFEDKYSSYLESLGGPAYRQKVLDYMQYEDTPRSLNFQLALLAKVGFSKIDILHKNSSFAAFGAIK